MSWRDRIPGAVSAILAVLAYFKIKPAKPIKKALKYLLVLGLLGFAGWFLWPSDEIKSTDSHISTTTNNNSPSISGSNPLYNAPTKNSVLATQIIGDNNRAPAIQVVNSPGATVGTEVPRTITHKQHDDFVRHVKDSTAQNDVKPIIYFTLISSDKETYDYLVQLKQLFRDAGYKCSDANGSATLYGTGGPPTGLFIGAAAQEASATSVANFLSLLANSGIDARLIGMPQFSSAEKSISIVVAQKP